MTQRSPRSRIATLAPIANALLVACLTAGPLLAMLPAAAQESAASREQARAYDIPAGPLDRVLNEFASRAGILLAIDGELTAGKTSPGLQGEYTIEEALQRMLAGTGVTYRFTGADTVTLAEANAQDGDGPVRLGPIMVEGLADNFGRLPTSTANVGETTTATRLPVDAREVPRSVGVVDEQLIEETSVGLRNLGDLSAFMSGVSQETNIARSGNFFVRGFPVGTRATIDGMRIPRRSGSDGTFTVTDMALYERVEVLKESSSILFGQGEPGGNVNYISKKPRFERAHSIEVGVSRDDYFRIVFDTTGPITDDIAFRVVGVAQNSNHFTPATKDDRLIVNPSVLWNMPSGGSLYVDYEYNHTNFIDGDNAVLIDGEVVPFQIHDPIHDFDEQFRTHNVRLQFKQPLTEQWTLALDGAWTEQDHLQRRVRFEPDSPDNPTQSEGLAFSQDRTDEGWGARIELQGDFSLGLTRHRLAVGYERFENDVDISRNLFGSFGAGPVFDQQFGAPLPAPLDPPQEFPFEDEETGVYLIHHMDLGERVHLMGGLRYADFENSRPGGQTFFDADAVSPSLGAVYDFTPQLSAYASWSRSFQPNRGMDINGNFFDPREGEQFEMGVTPF